MDQHQQMRLAASQFWALRPANLPNPEQSSASAAAFLAQPCPAVRLPQPLPLVVPAHNQQQPVIRRLAAPTPLGLFVDPAQMASPALPPVAVSPAVLGAPSSVVPTADPALMDQLMTAVAFQQILKAVEVHQKLALAAQLAGLQQPMASGGRLPSAFCSPRQEAGGQWELAAEQKTKVEEPPTGQTTEKPLRKQTTTAATATAQFVPNPSTSADELLDQAMARLVLRADAEQQQQMADGARAGTTAAAGGQLAGGEQDQGPSGCSSGSAGRPLPVPAAEEDMFLCKVCSDRASGFHYGIYSCEGCKGFFRRSLQNNVDYRPCTQSQKCQIQRSNRNRCQECRWRKCIEAGMSKDAVRYGRVPKREKEKLREELRRDSARTVLEHLAAEMADESALLAQLDRGWAQLGLDLAGMAREPGVGGEEAERQAASSGLLDLDRLCQSARAVIRFSSTIKGFRLLRREDRVPLIKEALFPVLLLRLSSLRSPGPLPPLESAVLARVLCLAQPSALRECALELIVRLREARAPVELALTDGQLALCAALCLCRQDGAGECAAGAATGACWDTEGGQQSAGPRGGGSQLGQAVTRRIRERLWQSLNASLSADQLPFGGALLRTDLLTRQDLAAFFERLKQLRQMHRQWLMGSNCANVPRELFMPPPSPRGTTEDGPAAGGGGGRKRKAAEEEKRGGGEEGREQQKAAKEETAQAGGQKDLPALRSALEQQQPVTGTGDSLRESHREVAQLLERRTTAAEGHPRAAEGGRPEQEQPLNLCLRDR